MRSGCPLACGQPKPSAALQCMPLAPLQKAVKRLLCQQGVLYWTPSS